MKKIASSMRKRYQLTRQGVLLLTERLRNLQDERKSLISRLKFLRSQQSSGRIAEDSICIQTMGSIQYVEAEIERVESALSNAEIVAHNKRRKRVDVGSTVRLSSEGGEIVYTIVPSIEADPFEGKISDESPMGRVLIGKKLKDMITLPQLAKRKARMMQLIGIE
jgi:transcription elongation factor GreA